MVPTLPWGGRPETDLWSSVLLCGLPLLGLLSVLIRLLLLLAGTREDVDTVSPYTLLQGPQVTITTITTPSPQLPHHWSPSPQSPQCLHSVSFYPPMETIGSTAVITTVETLFIAQPIWKCSCGRLFIRGDRCVFISIPSHHSHRPLPN